MTPKINLTMTGEKMYVPLPFLSDCPSCTIPNTLGCSISLSLFPIYFPSLKEFWEPISFPSFFFSILALFDCDQCAASRRKSNAAVVKKEATCWTFALWFSIYQWLIWHNLTVTPKWSHLSETFFIMIYKSKAWVYQVSSGVWRISALDGCSIETSLHHRLFSALCHSYFLSIHLFPFCLEMPC